MAQEEIIERVGQGYRFRPAAQVGLMLVLSVLGLWAVYEGLTRLPPPFNEPRTIITMSVIYVALIYPILIKLENRASVALSFGFFGAAIVAIAYWLVTYVQIPVEDPVVMSVAIALYVMFMQVLVIQLLHHLCGSYVFYKRDWRSYLIVCVLSAGFFACMWMLFGVGYGLGTVGIVLSVLLTMMFAWAVLPERPF